MSGGSYNYLCHKSPDDLVTNPSDLQDMVTKLSELGYAKDAARESAELLMIVRQFEVRAQTIMDRLNPVWKAVEWCVSGDWGEDSIQDALKKYRGEE